MGIRIIIFKWIIIGLAGLVSLMSLVSWIDVAIYAWPSTIDGWIPLLATTIIGGILIRLSFLNWNGITQD